jgi:hypothetical protein
MALLNIAGLKSKVAGQSAKSIKSHLARDGFQGALPEAVAIDSSEVAPDVYGVLAPWG